MSPSSSALEMLTRKYPQCQPLLEAFAPLLEARNTLASTLPAPAAAALCPPLDAHALSMGKPWMAPEKSLLPLYLDDIFLQAAPDALLDAAIQGIPQQKDALEALRTLFKASPAACRELAARGLTGLRHRTPYWAKKHGQDRHAAALLCLHLTGAAARRVARHAVAADTPDNEEAPQRKKILESWNKGHCPLCGSQPHAGFLLHKEGQRHLQCGLCGHTWRFSRTVCPVCEDAAPDGRLVFFMEGDPMARAEACTQCRTYILMPDMRAAADSLPLELVLLCLMPLDMNLQAEGYTSITALQGR